MMCMMSRRDRGDGFNVLSVLFGLVLWIYNGYLISDSAVSPTSTPSTENRSSKAFLTISTSRLM
jgi:hypothetical protein